MSTETLTPSGEASPELIASIRATVGRHLPPALDVDDLLDGVTADLAELIRGVDMNADLCGYLRGRAELRAELVEGENGALLPEWAGRVAKARGGVGPAVRALAGMLVEDESTPPALRALAEAYVSGAPARVHERVRSGGPSTSAEAARKITGRARPGGSVHKLLKAYHGRDVGSRVLGVIGLTAREAEEWSRVRAAHKRVSELQREGLLVVELDSDGREITREGGRVLSITPAGRAELERLEDGLQGRA